MNLDAKILKNIKILAYIPNNLRSSFEFGRFYLL